MARAHPRWVPAASQPCWDGCSSLQSTAGPDDVISECGVWLSVTSRFGCRAPPRSPDRSRLTVSSPSPVSPARGPQNLLRVVPGCRPLFSLRPVTTTPCPRHSCIKNGKTPRTSWHRKCLGAREPRVSARSFHACVRRPASPTDVPGRPLRAERHAGPPLAGSGVRGLLWAREPCAGCPSRGGPCCRGGGATRQTRHTRPAVATRGPAGERRGPESGRRDLSRDLSVESWGAGPQGSGPAQGLRAPWESALSESFAHESFRPRSWASSSMKPSWPSPLQRRGLPLPGGQRAVCLGHPLGGFVLGSLSRPFRPARHREGAGLAQTVPKGKKRGE